MELTRVNKENFDAFEPLMFGRKPVEKDIMIGAIEEGEAAAIAVFSCLGRTLILSEEIKAGAYRG